MFPQGLAAKNLGSNTYTGTTSLTSPPLTFATAVDTASLSRSLRSFLNQITARFLDPGAALVAGDDDDDGIIAATAMQIRRLGGEGLGVVGGRAAGLRARAAACAGA